MRAEEKHKIIWTIGHSTHPWNEFIEILQSFSIEILVDIRSYPGSKKYPQFNKDNMSKALPEADIKYMHMKDLGGRRKVKPDSVNTAWRHPAFRGYADYMEEEAFKVAIKELESVARKHRTAYMCSESLWWRCHRSLVSDYLKLQGWTVMHIMGKNKSQEHPFTQPAKIVGGKLSYADGGLFEG